MLTSGGFFLLDAMWYDSIFWFLRVPRCSKLKPTCNIIHRTYLHFWGWPMPPLGTLGRVPGQQKLKKYWIDVRHIRNVHIVFHTFLHTYSYSFCICVDIVDFDLRVPHVPYKGCRPTLPSQKILTPGMTSNTWSSLTSQLVQALATASLVER